MGEVRKEEVVIVGGGVAGLATALALKRVGIGALVLERSDKLRVTGGALTLASNAWFALEALGVAHKLSSIYSPFKKMAITNVENGVTQEVPSVYPQGSKWAANGPRSVHRRALLETLAEELPSHTIRFSSKLTYIETITPTHHEDEHVIVHLQDGTTIRTKVLIGCDGVHSVVSRWLGLKDPVHSGRFAVRGLSYFPQGHGLKHQVQQYVCRGLRFPISPLSDKELYFGLVYQPQNIKEEKMEWGDPKLIQENLLEMLVDFPDLVKDVIRHIDLSTITWGPLMLRYPWDVIFGQVSKGTVTVAGDAMHPMTPDLGQGGCASLEDAVILGRHIGNSFIRTKGVIQCDDVEKEIVSYVKERRWRTATMITASYLSGWVQQGGSSSASSISSRLTKFLRDTVFYRKLFGRVIVYLDNDCGKLPIVPKSLDLKDGDGKSE